MHPRRQKNVSSKTRTYPKEHRHIQAELLYLQRRSSNARNQSLPQSSRNGSWLWDSQIRWRSLLLAKKWGRWPRLRQQRWKPKSKSKNYWARWKSMPSIPMKSGNLALNKRTLSVHKAFKVRSSLSGLDWQQIGLNTTASCPSQAPNPPIHPFLRQRKRVTRKGKGKEEHRRKGKRTKRTSGPRLQVLMMNRWRRGFSDEISSEGRGEETCSTSECCGLWDVFMSLFLVW